MVKKHLVKDISLNGKEALVKDISFLRPASSNLYISGGVHRKKKIFPLKSQLMPLATFVPSLGRVGQCAWELCCSNIMKCFFWSDPCVFWYIF